jgi:hypothetical protein
MATSAETLSVPGEAARNPEDLHEQLMLDPLPRGEMNAMVVESMHKTTWRFWGVLIFLVLTILATIVGGWGYMILQGLGSKDWELRV